MKAWIKTTFKTITDVAGTRRVPDLGGHEAELVYSVFDMGDECVCRIAGAVPDVVRAVKASTGVTELTDDEVEAGLKAYYDELRIILREKHGDAAVLPATPTLDRINVPDPELDEHLKKQGIDPNEIRRNSGSTLKDQEYGAMRELARRKGIDVMDSEDIVKAHEGRCDAHERVMARLR